MEEEFEHSVSGFEHLIQSYIEWKINTKNEYVLNENERESLKKKFLSAVTELDENERLQIENFDFDKLLDGNEEVSTTNDYVLFPSFCALGFYDRKLHVLYSIGKYSEKENLDSYDFIKHSPMASSDIHKIHVHGMGWEFIKSEREIDVIEYYSCKEESDFIKKLKETGINHIDILIKKLNQACSDFE